LLLVRLLHSNFWHLVDEVIVSFPQLRDLLFGCCLAHKLLLDCRRLLFDRAWHLIDYYRLMLPRAK
jgi:hypothetical protein